MSPRPIPSCVLAVEPEVPAEAWQWVSPLRLRAILEPRWSYESRKIIIAVIDADAELARSHTLYGPEERFDWVELRVHLMKSLGRKIACEDGAPVIETEDVYGTNHLTTCAWCHKAPDEHEIIAKPSARPLPRCVAAQLPHIPATSWRWVSSVRLRAPAAERKHVAIAVIDRQGKHCFAYASVPRQEERIEALRLRTAMMSQLGLKINCQDSTPQLREDFYHPSAVAASDRGICDWCARTLDDHDTPAPERSLMSPSPR
jgi:hypothetical protein